MATDFVETRPLHKFPVKSGRDILDAQYKGGRSTIEKADWARSLYDVLKRRCPHVPEEQLVRLFHDRGQSQLEFIQGAATFLEYNTLHPIGKRRIKVRSRPASAVRVVPAVPAAPAKAAPKPPVKAAPPAAKKAVKPAPPKPAKAKVKPAKAPAKVAKKAAPKAKRRR